MRKRASKSDFGRGSLTVCRPFSRDTVEAELAQLAELGADALRQRWHAVTGRAPGPGLKGELLRALLAHKLQERTYGPLSVKAAKRLARLASQISEAEPAGSSPSNSAPATAARSSARRIKPGSRLLRQWQGVMHEVVVTADGFLWNGSEHASLSTIAKRITGTSWNGWRFFGVARGAQQRTKASSARADAAHASADPQNGAALTASTHLQGALKPRHSRGEGRSPTQAPPDSGAASHG